MKQEIKDTFRRIISDFHASETEAVSARQLELPVKSGKIITLTGPRRCGKSFYFFQLMKQLTDHGVPRQNLLYINFEDERFKLTGSDFDLIVQAYRELYPDVNLKNTYFFLDEIQNIEDWEKFVRRCYDTITKNIFLTGSNANLLSSEIATALRGRTLTYEILPLSFLEFLHFKKVSPEKYDSGSQAKVNKLFERYLAEGGYPEVTLLTDSLKNQALQEYFDVMTYRDLVERYNFTNLPIIKYFLKRVAASAGSYLSLNKLYNELRSQGYKLDKNFLYNVNEAAKAVYLSLPVSKFDYSELKRSGSDKKNYFIDNGLLNAITFRFSDDKGRLLENLAYLQFRRMGYEIFYYKDAKECDFVLQYKGKLMPVQVSYSLDDPMTKEREITGLVHCCKKLKLKKGAILAYTDYKEETVEGVTITYIPVVPYFLERYSVFTS